MSTMEAIASFTASAIPDEAAAEVARPAIADCFGCILAGAGSEVADRVCRALSPLGSGTTPVHGRTETLAAPHAALLNAVAGHAFDLDDWEEPANTHPTVVLLPTLLAAAGQRPCSGEELLAAYAIGCEIIMRLGETVTLGHYARGFHSTATLGTIGAAAAVSRLLGLGEERAVHALAIATSQAVGYTVQFGTNAKPLQAGFAARAGLESAFLAQAGATGQSHVLASPRGFTGLLGEHSEARIAALGERLGKPWALVEHGLILKAWPSCGYTHRVMTAALELRPELLGRLDEIAAIGIVQPDFHAEILPFHNPASRNEALFSAPACLAQALVTGGMTLADSEAGFWRDAEVARLITLTAVTAEPARDMSRNFDPGQPDRLRITLRDGQVLEASCAYPLGAPQNPMTQDQLAHKYQSITGRPASDFKALLDWIEAPDIAAFFREVAE